MVSKVVYARNLWKVVTKLPKRRQSLQQPLFFSNTGIEDFVLALCLCLHWLPSATAFRHKTLHQQCPPVVTGGAGKRRLTCIMAIKWWLVCACALLRDWQKYLCHDNLDKLVQERQEMIGFCGCSGISWTICKSSVPHFRQITTLTLHLVFTHWILFLMPNCVRALKAINKD